MTIQSYQHHLHLLLFRSDQLYWAVPPLAGAQSSPSLTEWGLKSQTLITRWAAASVNQVLITCKLHAQIEGSVQWKQFEYLILSV